MDQDLIDVSNRCTTSRRIGSPIKIRKKSKQRKTKEGWTRKRSKRRSFRKLCRVEEGDSELRRERRMIWTPIEFCFSVFSLSLSLLLFALSVSAVCNIITAESTFRSPIQQRISQHILPTDSPYPPFPPFPPSSNGRTRTACCSTVSLRIGLAESCVRYTFFPFFAHERISL